MSRSNQGAARKSSTSGAWDESIKQLGRSGLLDRWAKSTAREIERPADQFDERFMRGIVPLMELWGRYFDAEVRGMERVPSSAALLVGNHSGGSFTPDTSALYVAWYRERGYDDPLYGLAFDAMFGIPGMRELMRKIGMMPASMKNAGDKLAEGRSVLVYPGGSYEAFRPWTERNRVCMQGRYGFVKLALKTGVPIVPVVGHGGHDTLLVLSRGERIAELVGADIVRSDVWPILLQFPWGVSSPALPGMPLPAKITVEVCEPLDFSSYGPDAADDDTIVKRCHAEVTRVMQSTLDALAREHPHPLRERVRRVLRR